ncbi:unnamed protein product, partial [Ectocarpus fasciculatus]
MFRLFGGKKATFKPVKPHKPGSKREVLHEHTRRTLKTLGSGNMRAAVQLPAGEDINEWLASNTVDFFNEISLIWGIVNESGVIAQGPGEGFPPGFEYLWADGVTVKTPIRCSAPQYIDYVMTWVEEHINNEAVFPSSPDVPFPRNYMAVVKSIFTRMFRIFAIIYTHHFSKLEELGAVAHLNTSFKHYLFFIWEFDLVDAREIDALRDIAGEL